MKIILQYNIIDFPKTLLDKVLAGQSLTQFCEEFSLDYLSLDRLNCEISNHAGGTIGKASLRWFTPAKIEVDFCGHATFAAAHALFFEVGPFSKIRNMNEIHFTTKSGIFIARKRSDRSIELDFPIQTVLEEVTCLLPTLRESFPQLKELPVLIAKTSTNDVLVVISKTAFFTQLEQVNFLELMKIDCRGVCITCEGGKKDELFSSRFFGPRVGINEDPVTGSAHCYLAPYWGKRLETSVLLATQHSSRPGSLICEVQEKRVLIRATSTVSWRGEVIWDV